ncbi:ABC transporter ATP-binding protein [Hoeflea alexandrii]|uniref:ABC transporter ATP-binding protein n=1 Tax=Hoeflea alexandrii TaxID=288436 RepID=UPI0022AFDE59|nr:ABC transporter ATP-binding protein [Hoeflea alexandrii]MCZ4292242.1 ABC transporter ATP-binding protein [Hoeflea alexandrii]
MSVLLTATDLSVSYGKVVAVHNIAIELPGSGIVTLIGANGAGKSTTLLSLMGVLPAKGKLMFDGIDITKSPVEERVEMGISLVSEKRDLFSSMSVEDNLRLGCYRRNRSHGGEALEEVFGRFPRLKERRRQLAATLSGGERQMLAMGRALMARPRLLMLDEPSLGLAPLIVRDIFRIVTDLRDSGIAILLVEQNARAALEVASAGYVMELGEITTHGPASELINDRRLIESYLGIG